MMERQATGRLCRDDGSILVEFGLVLVPLMMVIVGIMEVGLGLLAQQVLQANTSNAVRFIERGEGLGLTPEEASNLVRQGICSGTLVLVGEAACAASLKLDMRQIDGQAIPSLFSNGALDGDAFGSVNGAAGTNMLVRAVLVLPSLTTVFPDLVTFNGGQRIAVAYAVFRIDPRAETPSNGVN